MKNKKDSSNNKTPDCTNRDYTWSLAVFLLLLHSRAGLAKFYYYVVNSVEGFSKQRGFLTKIRCINQATHIDYIVPVVESIKEISRYLEKNDSDLSVSKKSTAEKFNFLDLETTQNSEEGFQVSIQETKKDFEELLTNNTKSSYNKESKRLIEAYETKKQELTLGIAKYVKSKNKNISVFTEELISKHLEITKIFKELISLAYRFEQNQTCERLINHLNLKDAGFSFITIHHSLDFFFNKPRAFRKIVELYELLLDVIELSLLEYLKADKRYLYKDYLEYILFVFLKLNYNLKVEQQKLEKKTKGFNKSKNTSLIKQKINSLNLLQVRVNSLLEEYIVNSRVNDEDILVTLYGISWSGYICLLDALEEASWCRLSYCDGVLELMSPGIPHEEISENAGEIIKEYCFQQNIKCFALRSADQKNKKGKKGKQPDSSYALKDRKKIPDIAIEVNITSGSIKDLTIYEGIEVPEVWMFNDKEKKIQFFILEEGEYVEVYKSKYLPLLTPNKVNEILKIGYEEKQDINEIKREVINFLNSCKIQDIRVSSS